MIGASVLARASADLIRTNSRTRMAARTRMSAFDRITVDPYLEPDDTTAVLAFAARQNDHPVLRRA
jgi:hypothetical protein